MIYRILHFIAIVSMSVLLLAESIFYAPLLAAENDSRSPPNSAGKVLPDVQAFVRDQQLATSFGLLAVYFDDVKGKLYLEFSEHGSDFIYADMLISGVGSADFTSEAGTMDRGMAGRQRLVAFRRFGPRALLIERNPNYLTPDQSLGSPRDAGQSFANAVIWGFDVVAMSNGHVLIDATAFFQRDGLNVPGLLQEAKQGSYKFDGTRSAINFGALHNSPRSTDVEVLLTFSTDAPTGDEDAKKLLDGVVADRSAITIQQRHSFFALPDSEYEPRIYDPRSGFFDVTYRDPSAAWKNPLERRYIARFRLKKREPWAASSAPINPIVFYVDHSVPPEYRQDVIDGATWWNSAFEAAGFKDAFHVKLLPPNIDPMAAGVNIILWTPRSSRGWSHGATIKDPRTGEILKSIIRLDGMRLRFDRLLFEGLIGPHAKNADTERVLDAALRQRLRALTAHEVGHGLGLRHQFIGSAQSNSSVMDYPFPKIEIGQDGRPVIRTAYSEGVGEWDRAAVRYGYRQFGSGENEAANLEAELKEARTRGLYWMTDEDANGGAEPVVQRWDQGRDPLAELDQTVKLRAAALAHFSTDVIPESSPLALAQDTLVPVYLIHRFEMKSVASMLAGLHYEHAMRDSEPPRIIPGDQQRRALTALLATLDPKMLALPEKVLALMVPRPTGYEATRESFVGNTGITFDAIHPAIDAAKLTLDELLDKRRAARMIEFNARDGSLPSFEEVLNDLIQATWKKNAEQSISNFEEAVRRAVARTTLDALLALAVDQKARGDVRAACWGEILELRNWLRSEQQSANSSLRAHYALAMWTIDRVERDPAQFKPLFDAIPPDQPMGHR